ncbi:hypothetical protein KAH81_09240 [bacterium]|nr:hypothetical protein [bacterium]
MLVMAGISWAQPGLKTYTQIPEFEVVSGDGEVLTRPMLEGKITAIIYLSRKALGKNKYFSDELLRFYSKQDEAVQEKILRVAIINSSKANWPITEIWKRKLIENSIERGLTVYGDWDGNMLKDFGFLDEESNVIIIHSNLEVRYFNYGRIDEVETEKIKQLLMDLVTNN